LEKAKKLYQSYGRYIFRYMFGLRMDHHIADEFTPFVSKLVYNKG